MRGPSWPFVLPAGAQFVGGGACKMQAHPALRSACTGFCAVVCKPGWKISVTKQMGSVCNKSDAHGVGSHRRCAVPCHMLHWFRDFCAACLEGALECPLVQCTGASWSQSKLGIFQGTAAGINDSYCQWQVLFLWLICHRKLCFWMQSKMTAFSWCWYQSLVSNLINPPSAFVFFFFNRSQHETVHSSYGPFRFDLSLCERASGASSMGSQEPPFTAEPSHNRLGEQLGRDSR